MSKIIIAGGTGYIGGFLAQYFLSQNLEVIIITRKKTQISNKIQFINWNDDWQKALENSTAIINLTGKSINCLFTEKNKKEIIETRLEAVSTINQAILKCKTAPKVFINASGISIYKCSFDKTYNEFNQEFGDSFLADVCKQWEKEFYKIITPKTRKIVIRIAPVLGNDSATIKPLKQIVPFGLGGKQGNGKQYFPWIHEKDFIKAIVFIIKTVKINGTVNLVAPKPITNAIFMTAFRKVLKAPFGLPTPSFLLFLSKYVTKVEPVLILDSLKVVPKKLLDNNFEFEFNTIEKALKDIVLPIQHQNTL